uniref:Saposin B-type domain-containing protein n=1 Tax=Terrapene triunguis TaxID=2587831 RepID=A0A674I624_9SAUR
GRGWVAVPTQLPLQKPQIQGGGTKALAGSPLAQQGCAEGPTFWCRSLATAVQCGAVQICAQAAMAGGWVGAEDMCADCGQIVTILTRMAKDSAFKDSIQKYLTHECTLLPLHTLVPHCQKVVDTYFTLFIACLEGQIVMSQGQRLGLEPRSPSPACSTPLDPTPQPRPVLLPCPLLDPPGTRACPGLAGRRCAKGMVTQPTEPQSCSAGARGHKGWAVLAGHPASRWAGWGHSVVQGSFLLLVQPGRQESRTGADWIRMGPQLNWAVPAGGAGSDTPQPRGSQSPAPLGSAPPEEFPAPGVRAVSELRGLCSRPGAPGHCSPLCHSWIPGHKTTSPLRSSRVTDHCSAPQKPASICGRLGLCPTDLSQDQSQHKCVLQLLQGLRLDLPDGQTQVQTPPPPLGPILTPCGVPLPTSAELMC